MPSLPGGDPSKDMPSLPDGPGLNPAAADGAGGGGSGGGGSGAAAVERCRCSPRPAAQHSGRHRQLAEAREVTPRPHPQAVAWPGAWAAAVACRWAVTAKAAVPRRRSRTPGLTPDEVIYTEDREWTENYIGQQAKRRASADSKDGK